MCVIMVVFRCVFHVCDHGGVQVCIPCLCDHSGLQVCIQCV